MTNPVNFDPNNQINRVQRQNQTYGPRPQGAPQNIGQRFQDTLQQVQQTPQTQGLRFSNHAQQRIEKRAKGIVHQMGTGDSQNPICLE